MAHSPVHEFRQQILIRAPIERVWERLVDWERLSDWMSEASEFKVTSERREGVGVTAQARIKIAGISTKDSVEVVVWEPPERLEIAHLGWVKGGGVMSCRQLDGDVLVTWTETLIPPLGWLGWTGMLLLRRVIRHTFQKDIILLKTLVE